jgi:hypothetical protein
MLDWLKKLFGKKSVIKKIPVKIKLKTLKTGDLIEVILEKNFCAFALNQPKLRFSKKELTERKVRGTVMYSFMQPEIGCNVIDVQTVDTEFGVITKTVSILEDEIEDIIVHE